MQNDSKSSTRRTWLVALNALAIAGIVAMASFTGCGGGDSSTSNIGSDGGDSTTCSNTQSDPMNCGTCGHACMAGQVCSAGMCASMCGANSSQCGQSCVNTQNDNANCGSCSNACKMGEVCSQGKCGASCGGGTKLCGSNCVDTNVDPKNCGGCGTSCAAGRSCVMGSCVNLCSAGQTYCPGGDGSAGYCANEQTDNSNCGGCGTKCPQGEVCSGGNCGSNCGQGEKLCTGDGGAYCANTNSDNANCGDCGIACGGGQVCAGGKCQNGCVAADGGVETLCTPDGGAPYCADTDNDNTNCGGCGVACGLGQVCQNGQCANGCVAPDGGTEALCQPDGGSPYCADTNDDNGNCGGCGIACGIGQTCQNGTCVNGCPAQDGGTLTLCMPDGGAPFCTDTSNDPGNCGGCGNACAVNQVCIGGTCANFVKPLKVGVMDGSFYTDTLRTYLAGQPNIKTADQVTVCDAATLGGYDVIILYGNMPCFDANAFDTFTTNGGGLIGTPWIWNNYGGVPALPVTDNGSTNVFFNTPLAVTVTNPNDVLLKNVTFVQGNAVGYEERKFTLNAGATNAVTWNDADNTIAAAKWTYGSGRGVYVDLHYITSDCQLAINYTWGKQLIYNAVQWAGKNL